MPLFFALLIATALWAAEPTKTPRHTLWLDVQSSSGSDISDWTLAQAERILQAEPHFEVITHAEKQAYAKHSQVQPLSRLANSDSLYRLQRKPAITLEIKLNAVRNQEGRVLWLPMVGQRTLLASGSFRLISDSLMIQDLQGELSADSTWWLGYCGILECETKPLSAVERLPIEKKVTLRLLERLRDRLHQAVTVPLRERAKSPPSTDSNQAP
jgi:hypothetical protein